MAWNHNYPIGAGFDWSSVDFLNELILAHNERIHAIASISRLDFVRAGDDVQDARGTLYNLQWRAEALSENFIPESIFNTLDQYSFADNVIYGYTSDPDDNDRVYVFDDMSVDGWTRKHPRYIDATDDGGNDGERAYLNLGTDADPSSAKTVYEYDGDSSTWLVSDDQLTAPDTVTETGRIEVGDYIGPWIFNEIREMLRLMKYVIEGRTDLNNPAGGRWIDYESNEHTGFHAAEPFEFETHDEAISHVTSEAVDSFGLASTYGPDDYISVGGKWFFQTYDLARPRAIQKRKPGNEGRNHEGQLSFLNCRYKFTFPFAEDRFVEQYRVNQSKTLWLFAVCEVGAGSTPTDLMGNLGQTITPDGKFHQVWTASVDGGAESYTMSNAEPPAAPPVPWRDDVGHTNPNVQVDAQWTWELIWVSRYDFSKPSA